jgi:hypothetical protein
MERSSSACRSENFSRDVACVSRCEKDKKLRELNRLGALLKTEFSPKLHLSCGIVDGMRGVQTGQVPPALTRMPLPPASLAMFLVMLTIAALVAA